MGRALYDILRDNGICKRVLIGKIKGRKSRSRPGQRWMNTWKTDLTKTELKESENRVRWWEIVDAAKKLNGLYLKATIKKKITEKIQY